MEYLLFPHHTGRNIPIHWRGAFCGPRMAHEASSKMRHFCFHSLERLMRSDGVARSAQLFGADFYLQLVFILLVSSGLKISI